jgi:hypothetical protein
MLRLDFPILKLARTKLPLSSASFALYSAKINKFAKRKCPIPTNSTYFKNAILSFSPKVEN